MFSSSREGFSHLFLVDLINTCHREVSPLLRFPWLFQHLSSVFCFSWYYFNYSVLLLLDLNRLNSPWVLSGKKQMLKRSIVARTANGVTGDTTRWIMQIFLYGLLITLLIVTMIRAATGVEAGYFCEMVICAQ